MALTGSQFVTIIRRALGDRDTIAKESSLNDSVIYAVNSTIDRIAADQDLLTMQKRYSSTITTDDYVFSLPERTKSVRDFRLIIESVGYPLQYISRFRKADVFPETNSTINATRPCVYGRENADYLWVHPYPDQSYTVGITCSIWPAAITINSAHTLGDRYDHVIASGAIAVLFQMLQEPEDYEAWEARYLRELKEQIAAEKEKPDWTPQDSPSRTGARYLKPGNYLTSPWYTSRR